GKSVDWYSKVFQAGLRQDYNLSVSGRTDDISYYLGGGYLNNQGIVVNDNFNTVRTRANVEARVNSFLKLGINTQFSVRDESSVPNDWNQITSLSPWGSEYDAEGQLVYRPNGENSGGVNPAYDVMYTDRMQKTTAL